MLRAALWLTVASLAAAESFDRARAIIVEGLRDGSVPSIAVAVGRNGKIVWEEGFGWADREKRLAATEHTMYSLASVSKPVTATGLMVLKHRGQIDLDRPVNDYLGEAKISGRAFDARQATVRRVANHTAGLPLHYQFFYEDEPYRRPPMDETIRRYGNLLTPPGERFQYSNLGYGVLDHVIERVSGRSYEDFLREQVFVPLGLTRTSVGIGPRQDGHHAIRYGADGLPIPFYDFDHRGGSAIYASAHDLVRFGMFHLKLHLADQQPILPDPLIDEMQRAATPPGPYPGYGVGWTVDERGGRRIVSHGGGMGGVATTLNLYPADKAAIVVLANARAELVGRVQQAILEALLPPLEPRVSDGAGGPQTTPLPGPLAGEWRGAVHTYKGEIGFVLKFLPSGDVHVRLGQQLWTLLNDPRLSGGDLAGRFNGDIGTEDANRRPYVLALSLKHRGDALNGAVTALSTPGRRVGNALSHWVEAKKQ